MVHRLGLILVSLACGCGESQEVLVRPCATAHDAGARLPDLGPSASDFAEPNLAQPDLAQALDASTSPNGEDIFVGKHRYLLPDDAQRNTLNEIGPFCCVGATVTVPSESGRPLGYALWFDPGSLGYYRPDGPYVDRISVFVSGPPNYDDVLSQVQSEIDFDGNEIGLAGIHADGGAPVVKSATAGILRFTISLTQADIAELYGDGVLFMNMWTLRAVMYVETIW